MSDEHIVARWKENPYWQFFCGEEYFKHELPFHPTSLTKWRNRLGKKGCETLLKATIESAEKSQMVAQKDFKKVIVDSTVQEKNIRFPTDSALLEKARQQLIDLCKEHALVLRQNYNREAPGLAIKVSRYAHAKQFKRMKKP